MPTLDSNEEIKKKLLKMVYDLQVPDAVNAYNSEEEFVDDVLKIVKADREAAIREAEERGRNIQRLLTYSSLVHEMLLLGIAIKWIRTNVSDSLAPEAYDRVHKIVTELGDSIDQSQFNQPTKEGER